MTISTEISIDFSNAGCPVYRPDENILFLDTSYQEKGENMAQVTGISEAVT